VNVLVCVKRVPAAGGRMTLTPDGRDIDTRHVGFTVSPHEECAVEEAVRLIERHGGASTVLTLGPEKAVEQLRDAMSMGIDNAVLLPAGGRTWDPGSTAQAIVQAIGAQAEEGTEFDLLLFGNEAADTCDYQVGIRVATALGLPCVTGVKALELRDGVAVAERESGRGREVYEVPLPAAIAVREGINLPRYPSLPGRIRAKKKPIVRFEPPWGEPALEMVRLVLPKEQERQVDVLGTGPTAAPRLAEVLRSLGVA
jgi:electron transfer flavoprotein beta subunit